MPTDSPQPLPLPPSPNIRHLKDQAKDLLKAGGAHSLADAQWKIARRYGFASWPKLRSHIRMLEGVGPLKEAIDRNDLDLVKTLMTADPELHRAPMGCQQSGPLTWVAECRIPRGRPTTERLEIAAWMIDHGSDVHQGGDCPLRRAALRGERIAMMDILVRRGADVNAQPNGHLPILFAPCETVDPTSLQWLLNHGADPNGGGNAAPVTPLDYLLGSYVRSPKLAECIDILLAAGGRTSVDIPIALELLQGRLGSVEEMLVQEPTLLTRRFPELNFGATGERRLTLKGATLLHVAAEYGNVEAVEMLLDRGADVNSRAAVDGAGVGGQTPLFHAVTQFGDHGLAVTKLLLARGADLTIRATVPGHYERPREVLTCTASGYAQLFPEGNESPVSALLLERGTPE